jgi:hypothetical protein
MLTCSCYISPGPWEQIISMNFDDSSHHSHSARTFCILGQKHSSCSLDPLICTLFLPLFPHAPSPTHPYPLTCTLFMSFSLPLYLLTHPLPSCTPASSLFLYVKGDFLKLFFFRVIFSYLSLISRFRASRRGERKTYGHLTIVNLKSKILGFDLFIDKARKNI